MSLSPSRDWLRQLSPESRAKWVKIPPSFPFAPRIVTVTRRPFRTRVWHIAHLWYQLLVHQKIRLRYRGIQCQRLIMVRLNKILGFAGVACAAFTAAADDDWRANYTLFGTQGIIDMPSAVAPADGEVASVLPCPSDHWVQQVVLSCQRLWAYWCLAQSHQVVGPKPQQLSLGKAGLACLS